MNKLNAAIVYAAAACCIAFGQQTTVFQPVATSASAPTTVSLRNIGQLTHRLVVQVASAPSQTCAADQVTNISLQASFDGSNWWRISQNTGILPAAPLTRILTAEGAYPYLRAAVTSFDTTNCRISATYIGSQSGSPGSPLDGLDYGLVSVDLSTASIGSPVEVVPAVAGLSVVVYEVQLWNQTGPQRVQVQDSADNILANWTDIPTGARLLLNKNQIPFWATMPGEALEIGIENATNVSGYIRYRYE